MLGSSPIKKKQLDELEACIRESGAASPATFGWIRPVILLPDVCLRQDQSELEDILRYELHHVRRRDFAWNGFAVLCRALLFFHSTVWYTLRKMQFDRELACDLAVVSDTPRRRAEYAECLLHFARLNAAQDPQAWGIDFAASSNHLKAGVHSILTETKVSSGWLLGLRIACSLVLIAKTAEFIATDAQATLFCQYALTQAAAKIARRTWSPHFTCWPRPFPTEAARCSIHRPMPQ